MTDYEKISLLENYFLNRKDTLAAYVNKSIQPVLITENLSELLKTHVTGIKNSVLAYYKKSDIFKVIPNASRFGTYTPNKEGATRWAVIDIDGEGHATAVKDILDVTKKILSKIQENGFIPYLERSSGGTGYHIWVFFKEYVPAILVRKVFQTFLPEKILLANGKEVQGTSNKGVELYPKAATIKEDGYGNAIWLPFGYNTQSTFGRLLEGEFKEIELTEIQINSITQLQVIEKRITTGKLQTLSPQENAWKEQALKCLDLNSVYGDVLAEPVDENLTWIKCRDPWAENGDEHPSAGVATGRNGYERGSFHSFITGEFLSVFDYILKKGLVSKEAESFAHVARITGVPQISLVGTGNTFGVPVNTGGAGNNNSGNNNSGNNSSGNNASNNNNNGGTSAGSFGFFGSFPKSQIQVRGCQMIDIVDGAWRVLEDYNKHEYPKVFSKNGILCEVDFKREIPRLKSINDVELFGLLNRIASWVSTNRGGFIVDDKLPKEIPNDMLVCQHSIRNHLPDIDSVITTPIFSSTGEMVYKEGYNPSAKVWYYPTKDIRQELHEISLAPTFKEVEDAKHLLDEVFIDFPFVAAADKAHTYASVFLPFIRPMIDGPTPMHVVEAPIPGTGKSKICNVVGIIFTGEKIGAASIPNGDEAIRKTITALLRDFKPIILLDNASEKKKLESASLAAIISSVYWEDRLLGESEMLSLKNNSLWFMTGNNPQFSMELARRCVRIRIDPKIDQPWKRNNFKHPELENWVKDNRPALVKAVLTCIQYWISQGKPFSKKRLGSFESWSSVMGGLLDCLKIPGFMCNLDELYEQADSEGGELRVFVMKWAEEYKGEEVQISKLLQMVEKHLLLPNMLEEGPQRARTIKLTGLLKQVRDRTVGNYKIVENRGTFYLQDITRAGKTGPLVKKTQSPKEISDSLFND